MLKEFAFYLDAWNWCRQNSVDISKITRYNMNCWTVKVDKAK